MGNSDTGFLEFAGAAGVMNSPHVLTNVDYGNVAAVVRVSSSDMSAAAAIV